MKFTVVDQSVGSVQVKLLDLDTISQAKDKVLDAVYKVLMLLLISVCTYFVVFSLTCYALCLCRQQACRNVRLLAVLILVSFGLILRLQLFHLPIVRSCSS